MSILNYYNSLRYNCSTKIKACRFYSLNLMEVQRYIFKKNTLGGSFAVDKSNQFYNNIVTTTTVLCVKRNKINIFMFNYRPAIK